MKDMSRPAVLKRSRPHYLTHINKTFLGLSIAIVLLSRSLVALYSVSASQFKPESLVLHIVTLLFGIVFMYLFSVIRIDAIYIASIGLYGLALAANLTYIFLPQSVKGYITIGTMRFDVTQSFILSTCLMVAVILSKKRSGWSNLISVLVVLVPAAILLVSDRSNGTLLLLLIGCCFVFLHCKLRSVLFLFIVFFILLIFALTSPGFYDTLEPWLDPFSDPLGRGYPAVQSLYAIASGGLWGQGFSSNAPSFFLLREQTYILSGIIHQGGIAVTLIICITFIVFFVSAGHIALKAPVRFHFYLSMAILIRFFVLTAVDLMVVCNLLPYFSCYLPFYSSSPSFLLYDCFSLGVLLNISRTEA